jgi:ribosomal protein S1
LPAVRVKEFNYFDGKPVLSMREDVLNAKALNYESVQIGDVLYAAIDGVNTATKVITLKVSEFVKGVLPLEHMADHPLKVIPPKLTEVGKQIKVRVFAIDNRTIIFTKKDTFLKEKCPVFSSPAEIGKGEKLYGVVVGQTEYGFVVKSFGGVKGLLTFEEIKKSTS